MITTITRDTCLSCPEKERSLFNSCGLTKINFGPKSVIQYNKGEFLAREGQELNGVICIKEGIIKVFKKNEGNKEFILWLAKPGDIIGIDSFFNGEPYRFNCQAIANGKACFIPKEDFKMVLSEGKNAFAELVQILCSRINFIEERITNIAQKKIREQLADVLLTLALPYTYKNETSLVVSFSIKDIANIIGTTRNYLYKVLFDFSNKGLVTIEKRRIFIKDEKALKALAYKGLPAGR